jgi:hypothetical protein
MFEVKEELTIENILNKVDEYNIFKTYCSNFKDIDKPFKSELYNDTKASCRITFSHRRLWYKDFGESERAIDCFTYIMKKYNLSFQQALGLVSNDFNLGLQKPKESIIKSNVCVNNSCCTDLLHEKRDTEIKVKYRNWTKNDVLFWNGLYHIEKETLNLYKTRPIKYSFLNGKFYIAPKLSFASLIDIENSRNIYKIYSPFTIQKWICNCKSHNFLGYNQLPWVGDLLIITKSLKDVMVLYQYGYPAIAPQGENVPITEEFMTLLKKRFRRVVLFYDNDEAGIKAAKKIVNKHKVENIILPVTDAKDISDYVKDFGFHNGKLIMEILLKQSEESFMKNNSGFLEFAEELNTNLHAE